MIQGTGEAVTDCVVPVFSHSVWFAGSRRVTVLPDALGWHRLRPRRGWGLPDHLLRWAPQRLRVLRCAGGRQPGPGPPGERRADLRPGPEGPHRPPAEVPATGTSPGSSQPRRSGGTIAQIRGSGVTAFPALPGGLSPEQRERILEAVVAGITREKHLNPERRHRTYPRVVKRSRHSSYRVERPGDRGTRHPGPATISMVNPRQLTLAA